ncbi:LTA synthase family protein [Marinobacter mobilis]|uniref:Phosphoglycerol transferase MdoB n=1 Tax=Marinobacter mobilis TaxID=488533 RepID=A0A1H2WGQ5_9GAMM|nr:LTA synthase family protein [Marinobacter mobilis]SDW79780.1 Phosphoglycerol transferase MdoB [Marinobacter mobilis]
MLKHSFRFIVIALVTLTAWRLGLAVWQFDRIGDSSSFLQVMLGGLRIDLSIIAMISAIPLLLAPWLGHRPLCANLTAWWYRFWWVLLLFMELATPQFIAEYDARPHRLFFEYLVNPKEVSAMLFEGYKLAVSSVLGVLLVAVWGVKRLLPTQPDKPLRWWKRPVYSVAALLLCFLAARGTLDHRPINPALVAFSDDNLVNSLALNSFYSTAYAAYQLKHESNASEQYGDMPDQEVISLVRNAAGVSASSADPGQPSYHFQQAAFHPDRPLNLVIIVEESLGAQYVGALAGEGLTPELDKLATQGWLFSQAYATGTRSIRGLEALTTGFFPTPARAVLKLPRAQHGFFTLASYLGSQGYHSRFVYGGESHFDNMKGFFLGNGFDEVHDLPDFTDPAFVGSWGASDEDMFNELHRLLSQDTSPTLTVAFSVSNHSPWEYPEGRIQPVGEPACVENAIRYADWALGQFFAKAKASSYWQNTLFLVVADHDSRVYGASAVPVEHFRIPALILGPGVQPRLDDRLVSQVDLPPTLLSLMGISGSHPMLGQDLNVRSPNRALMQYGNTFGYRQGDQMLALRPGEQPEQFQVTSAGLLPLAVQQPLLDQALAHALWPSLAYRHDWYSTAGMTN